MLCPSSFGVGRVRGGRNKKLRSAFRALLDRRGATNEFLKDLVAEDDEAAALFAAKVQSTQVIIPDWAASAVAAWQMLRDDRSIGAMGGIGRIWYASASRYARDLGLAGEDAASLIETIMALDDEYLSFHAEQIEKSTKK